MKKAVVLCCLLWAATGYSASIQLSPLHPQDIEFGCGCAFGSAKTQLNMHTQLLSWGLDGPAHMRINGKPVTFKIKGPYPASPSSEVQRVGHQGKYTLKSKLWRGTLNYRVTQICSAQDQACEVTHYTGKLTLWSPQSRSVTQMAGVCGC